MAAESAAVAQAAALRPRTARGSVLRDYWALTKPEVNLLIVITTGAAFSMARAHVLPPPPYSHLLHTLSGTLLVASGAAALNQWMERRYDSRMRRTARRPVAAGRIPPAHALAFGAILSLAGTLQLLAAVGLAPALLAAATLASYLLLYTPLKRISPLCTLIGAVPGAAPPLIGWAAAGGRLDREAWLLWTIQFLWQLPHFMSIAWMYREDYRRAGYAVLPRGRMRTRLVALQTLLPLVGLVVATLPFGPAAILLSLGFLYVGLQFVLDESAASARRLLLASTVYLPVLLSLGVVFRALR
jgi:protoheme IX farnesyltransferase